MKKFKIWAAALLGLAMLAPAFAACATKTPKASADTLQIAVLAKGFGSDYLHALAADYQQRTGQKTLVTLEIPSSESFRLATKAVNSGFDLLFECWPMISQQLATKNYFDGYDVAYAELTDVYESPADPAYLEVQANPGFKIKDILNTTATEMLRYRENGKLYSMPYVMDITGLMYHKTLWDKDKTKLAAGNPSAGVPSIPVESLRLPKTTNEMFELFDRIKGVSGAGKRPYAFKYGGQNEELSQLHSAWLGQYIGMEEMEKFYEGKDANGKYTPDIFNQDGRKHALNAVRGMILKTNGYVDNGDSAKHIFNAEVDFLEGASYFHCNGSWLDREASTNFEPGTVDAGFVRLPVVSAIVEKWPAVFTGGAAQKDEQLRQVMEYIDGDTAVKPSFLDGHDGVLAHLDAARRTVNSQSIGHPVLIPAYSPHIAEAKDFLRYMFSKAGQEVMLRAGLGNMGALNVNPSQFDAYNSDKITYLSKTKMELFGNSVLVTAIPTMYPMNYLGGYTRLGTSGPTMESAFGGASPQATETYMTTLFNNYSANWQNWMGLAGVSN